ncbi:carboxypeptidase-like regulatory domain-containing protein [Mucilaginibacter pallidiroseus]|nr:carboxypeptidase-like regulatory domain-containing protein [Mucilaginibacter pallidiroseus]
MKQFLFISFLFFLSQNTFAQQISGRLIDANTREAIPYVLVATNSASAFTNEDGGFSLKALSNDTVKINLMGYKPLNLPVTNWGSQQRLITMEPAYRQLGEVTITAQRNHYRDSVNLRKEYAKQFNFRGPRFNEIFLAPSQYVPFAVMSINVTQLYKALTKKRDPNYKLQQTLLRDERESHVSARFNKALVASISHLKGDSLDNFMSAYRPTPAVLDKLNDYDLVRYIKTNLEKSKVSATRLDDLPVMLKPGQSLE